MRRFDKTKNILKANLLAEQRYLESKGLLLEGNEDLVDIQNKVKKTRKITELFLNFVTDLANEGHDGNIILLRCLKILRYKDLDDDIDNIVDSLTPDSNDSLKIYYYLSKKLIESIYYQSSEEQVFDGVLTNRRLEANETKVYCDSIVQKINTLFEKKLINHFDNDKLFNYVVSYERVYSLNEDRENNTDKYISNVDYNKLIRRVKKIIIPQNKFTEIHLGLMKGTITQGKITNENYDEIFAYFTQNKGFDLYDNKQDFIDRKNEDIKNQFIRFRGKKIQFFGPEIIIVTDKINNKAEQKFYKFF